MVTRVYVREVYNGDARLRKRAFIKREFTNVYVYERFGVNASAFILGALQMLADVASVLVCTCMHLVSGGLYVMFICIYYYKRIVWLTSA